VLTFARLAVSCEPHRLTSRRSRAPFRPPAALLQIRSEFGS
jgi:hypothetical protein